VGRIIRSGQFIFGIAMTAFGVENLICGRLRLTVEGVPWFSAHRIVAYVTGVVLLAAGLCIIANVKARQTTMILGALYLLYVLIFEVSAVIASPMSVGVRTVFFETLSLGASALILAGVLRTGGGDFRRSGNIVDKVIASGPYLLGISAVVFGIDHFLVLSFIASLVPAWLPGHMFWAYFTGAAFIVAGICMISRWMDEVASFCLGLMFLLWFLVLHSPRVVAAVRSHDPNSPDEWSSAFIALGIGGGCWICAWHARQRCRLGAR
jgi:uncharacterized membrane protein